MTRTEQIPLYQATRCRCNLSLVPLPTPVADIDERCPYCGQYTRYLSGPIVGYITREVEIHVAPPIVITSVPDYICRACRDTGSVHTRERLYDGTEYIYTEPCWCRGRKAS